MFDKSIILVTEESGKFHLKKKKGLICESPVVSVSDSICPTGLLRGNLCIHLNRLIGCVLFACVLSIALSIATHPVTSLIFIGLLSLSDSISRVYFCTL